MQLKVKDVNLSTGGLLVAILNEADAARLSLKASDRVKISRLRKKKSIIAVVDISSKGIEPGEIGLFEELLSDIGVEEGVRVNVKLVEKPKSISYIKNKLDGKAFSKEEIDELVDDIVKNRFSEIETTYFVSACYTQGLKMKETEHLTKEIVNSGDTLKFKDKVVIDKHCIGGVGGNRTTMLVIPIIASLGFIMPKTSSRAITSPSGTADTVEVIAPVTMSKSKILKVIKQTNGCMVWGGAMNLAGADDKLIKVRHPLRIDPRGMLLASILAKKKAVGSTHVLIDIPYGPSAKIESKNIAKELGRQFMKLGSMLNMKVKAVYTDGSQPIGNGIGPTLECNDVIAVLKNGGPQDLKEKAVYLATEILKIAGVKRAKEKVLESLNSGKAFEKFREIIVAQGGKKSLTTPKAKFKHDVKAEKDGVIKSISNKGISLVARLTGAPQDKTAGLYLYVHNGYKVKKGQTLFTLHSNSQSKIDMTVRRLHEIRPIIY